MDLARMLRVQEEYWGEVKKRQIQDPKSRWYGSYQDGSADVIEAGLPLYVNENSKYYRNSEILERMERYIDFMLKAQRPSGLFTFWMCNIESPPDTGFMINSFSICLKLIEKYNFLELDSLKQKMITFLERTIPAMITGGFHTPNHRWVMTAALGFLYERFGDERLKERAFEFLAEGFDCNKYGEWAERSNVIYNACCDMYCYHIAEIFGVEEEAYSAIRRNLDMMQYMFHSDGTIVTEYSTRQDKGMRGYMCDKYTIAACLMAVKDNNSFYAYLAEEAFKIATNFNLVMLYADLYKEQFTSLPEPTPVPEQYTVLLNGERKTTVPKQYSQCGDAVLRHRNGKLSVTVMAGQQDCMFMQYGDARAYGIKFSVAWFGLGGASFPGIEKIDDVTYRLYTPIRGKYWQVFDKEFVKQFNGDFVQMPNDDREDINVVYDTIEIIIHLLPDGMDLEITMDDIPEVFAQLVCMFDLEGDVSGARKESDFIFKLDDGTAVYERNGDCISVTATAGEHCQDVLRNDKLNEKAQNVIMNVLSPTKWKVELRGYERK
ncbi:MAG: hypothetical protein E7397_04780 [Ruminococcaceae bacterium]|nr:hypothetical protein [Oscillospiraceae bacterium]